MTEQNIARNNLYRHLMTVPHRDYNKALPQFSMAFENDPDFISRACVFLLNGGTEIRDQQDVAAITLLTAPAMYRPYRQAGKALLLGSEVYNTQPGNLSGFPPYRIIRVLQFLATYTSKSPRLMKTIATDYVKFLENDPVRFDSVVLHNRKGMKWLYAHFHIRPSDRAQQVIFDDQPPQDSKLAILKQIANSEDVDEQARLVIEHKIPYRAAFSVLPKKDARVCVALISAMSPTEALNSRSWVERSGILEIVEVKELYLDKVSRATKSVASADHRSSAQGQNVEVQQAVTKAKQTAVEKSKRIEKDLLILVDKSGSMQHVIDIAIEFGSRIAPLCDKELMVVAFNQYGQIINVEDRNDLQSWKHAFMGVRAGGGTSVQRGFETALDAGLTPQAIVLISDCEEGHGNFPHSLQQYTQLGYDPQIVIIGVSNRGNNHYITRYTQQLESIGVRCDTLMYEGDYYVFDQVGALLGGPPAKSLVERILETELPRIVTA